MKRLYMMLAMVAGAGLSSALSLAKTQADPGFSLRNKTNNDVIVKVNNFSLVGGQVIERVRPGNLLVARIDISSPSSMVVFSAQKVPLFSYSFTPGKTLYLNWGATEGLYPQRGPLKGLTKKTDEGYPLKNNIKSADIKRDTVRPNQMNLPLNI